LANHNYTLANHIYSKPNLS